MINSSKKTDQEKAKSLSITSAEAIGGSLLTFSFNVESVDEIKCYMYWSGQTQRFYPQDIKQILPYMFVDCDDFLNDPEGANTLIRGTKMNDRKFEQFYNEIKFNDKVPFPQTEFTESK